MTSAPVPTRGSPLRSVLWSATRGACAHPAAPGVVLLVLVWLVTRVRFDYPAWVEESYGLWQSLGRQALQEDPVASLMALHVQPPGLNLLEAIDLAVTPSSHLVLSLTFLAMAASCVLLIVDTLLLCGLPRRVALVAGLLFAALPATVIYALWPFSTTPTMFASTLAVWGVARLRRQPVLGVAASSAGAFLLMLNRSSFPWPFVLAWLAGLLIFCWASSRSWIAVRRQAVILAAVAVATLGLQAHYLVSFGLPTMSSWTGENLAKGLLWSGRFTVTEQAASRIAQDPCEQALLEAFQESKRVLWNPEGFRALPACASLPGLRPRGIASWDSAVKGETTFENFNWSERLVASRVWNSMMQKVVLDRPGQLVAMAISTPTGPRQSGVGIYLGPSEEHLVVKPIWDRYPVPQIGGMLSLLLAPGAIVLGALGAVAAVRRRGRGGYAPTLLASAGLVAYHVAVSTLVEYGENMRFQAEITPVLVILGFLGWWSIKDTAGRTST